MTHEALIPIRLDRQRLSYCLSLLSLASERGTCVCICVLISSRSVQTGKAWEMSTKSHCLLEPAIKIKPRAR